MAESINLTLSDLWTSCPKCNGTGRYRYPDPPSLPGQLVHSMSYETTCPDCAGSGGSTTESGKVILAFLRKAGR